MNQTNDIVLIVSVYWSLWLICCVCRPSLSVQIDLLFPFQSDHSSYHHRYRDNPSHCCDNRQKE